MVEIAGHCGTKSTKPKSIMSNNTVTVTDTKSTKPKSITDVEQHTHKNDLCCVAKFIDSLVSDTIYFCMIEMQTLCLSEMQQNTKDTIPTQTLTSAESICDTDSARGWEYKTRPTFSYSHMYTVHTVNQNAVNLDPGNTQKQLGGQSAFITKCTDTKRKAPLFTRVVSSSSV